MAFTNGIGIESKISEANGYELDEFHESRIAPLSGRITRTG